MIHYFQLTPDIFLEYVYEGDPKLNEDGIKGNKKDIYDDKTSTMLLSSKAFGTKYLCFANESEGLDSISNLVLPLNNSDTQFVVAKSKYQKFYSKLNASNIFSKRTGSVYMYEDTKYDSNIRVNAGSDSDSDSQGSCEVKYDKCILHFTSRNYFGSYDALIFQAYAYMSDKSKLFLSSFIFRRTSNLELKAEHLLYNEKLYTTQVEFDIPSVFAIFTKDNPDFNKALSDQNVELLQNTPIGINVYGVISTTKGIDNYERLRTAKIKSISIPYIYNRLDEIRVNISEAEDGDFYYIDPEMSANYPSFVDYIESMGEDIRAYIIMHELQLKEVWVDNNGITHSEITHREFHIINIHEDDEDEDIARRFDAKIKYRPICIKDGQNCMATIIDTIKIINTVDSSSYEVMGSLDIPPHKYGRRLTRLNVGNDSRPIINVYNKKVSDEKSATDKVLSMGRGGGFVVENKTQNITSFIESTNIGVSIMEISPEDIN